MLLTLYNNLSTYPHNLRHKDAFAPYNPRKRVPPSRGIVLWSSYSHTSALSSSTDSLLNSNSDSVFIISYQLYLVTNALCQYLFGHLTLAYPCEVVKTSKLFQNASLKNFFARTSGVFTTSQGYTVKYVSTDKK